MNNHLRKSAKICVRQLTNLRKSVGKLVLYISLVLLAFSCIKLEENDKRYSSRKLQKMLEGTWELTDYQIDDISFLDTFLKVNTYWNCKIYTFKQWKNASKGEKPDGYAETGEFYGDCQTSSSMGYGFNPRKKGLGFSGFYFIDSIYFVDLSPSFNVLKLEHNEMILFDESNSHPRTLYFKKQ